MTSVTHQKYDLRRKISRLMRQYFGMCERAEVLQVAQSLTSELAYRMTRAELVDWSERLELTVAGIVLVADD